MSQTRLEWKKKDQTAFNNKNNIKTKDKDPTGEWAALTLEDQWVRNAGWHPRTKITLRAPARKTTGEVNYKISKI